MTDPHQHDRDRARRARALNHEPNGYARPPRRLGMRVLLGLLLGSFAYLITSCFYDLGLHKPKFDRHNFKFDHRPDRPL